MDNYIELLKLLLPELLVTHFNVTKYQKTKEVLHLYFEEKSDTPKEEKHRILVSHGFHKELTIQDFPVRGKNVFLHIKRRRWKDKASGKLVQRDWDLVAQGTRMTVEFAAFLKVFSKY